MLDWRDDGYLPEALINYVALLGWTPEEAEPRTFHARRTRRCIHHFALGKSAARFDRKRLDWLNGEHIRMLSPSALCDRVLPILEKTDSMSPRNPAVGWSAWPQFARKRLQR